MNRYLIRRLLFALPTLLAISFIIYAIISLAPGDPLSQFAANPAVPPEVRENIRRSLGLDKPWYERYFSWLISLVTEGNMGFSFSSRLPVTELIFKYRLLPSLWVVGVAYILSVLLAIPLGILSAVKQYSIFDQFASTLSFIGFSVPTFFTGTMAILIFGVSLNWFPWIFDSSIVDNFFIKGDLSYFGALVKQSVLPVMVLGFFQTATLMRYVRASMLENLPLDYVRTARSKGLSERLVIVRHVMRNSLIPVVTLVALQLPAVFTGAIVTEQIFRVPGIGSLIVSAVDTKDTPVVMAVTIIYSVLVVVFNLLADMIYGFLDPRIKYS
ncbi:MAG: ABC transporter permease [Chloroflexi bacterium]|nr:ABC transporter permease [Chloroflexota bacterium]